MSKKNKRVVIAMSGGVDSAVAAALLKQEGYQVIGMTMKIWPKISCGTHKERACCSLEGITDARAVAEKLGIPYYVIDLAATFKKEIIDYFCREYTSGRTPNPCIVCNEKMKFGHLLLQAKKLRAGFIATGHHAKVGHDTRSGRYLLRRGKDKAKDQSYVLFSLSQEQLAHTLAPIGEHTKLQVRTMARRLGLRHVYRKPSSQEICFVPDRNFAKFLTKEMNVKASPGPIVDTTGNVLGTHRGSPFYTVGQRHGLGIAHKRPLYVLSIDAHANKIIVGEKHQVRAKAFITKDNNWIAVKKLSKPSRLKVKIRYAHRAAPATVAEERDGTVRVEFDEPQEAITPGQAAVFYKADVVVGGGWIDHAL
jgi:tRNA-specific 2-thiouridylase